MSPDLERISQTNFWKSNALESSIEEMLLDSKANEISPREMEEVLSYLPNLQNKKVLELGSGIGRFTGFLAKQAAAVTAMDFQESFIAKNKARNGHLGNIDFQCVDVTQLELADREYDFIFTNWLFMYLGDDEVIGLVNKMAKWLKPEGQVFVRESCYHPSGDTKRGEFNPTRYRTPVAYETAFASAVSDDDCVLHLEKRFVIHTYVEMKNNGNQRAWLFQKRGKDLVLNDSKTFQYFLDNQQYSRRGILKYERIFGKDFVSTGGKDTTEEILAIMGIQKQDCVLDVGCGIGGGDFLMEFQYGAKVRGIDLSENMVHFANVRGQELGSHVDFAVEDATLAEYPPGSFDFIYSRDTILHISDKLALFRKFHSWLKKGGKVVITDYCCGKYERQSQAYKDYVKGRGYHLLTVNEYGQVLESAGFAPVEAIDKTDLFVESLNKELAVLESIKKDYIAEFSEKDYDDIKHGWTAKLAHCSQKDHAWGLFIATKP